MSKPTNLRKERERAVREELILTHARRLLLSNGFQGLSLDELARSIEYSKGTIYLHFESKEDIAAMAAFLCSDRATNITGQTINVDGGYVMHS